MGSFDFPTFLFGWNAWNVLGAPHTTRGRLFGWSKVHTWTYFTCNCPFLTEASFCSIPYCADVHKAGTCSGREL